MKPVQSREWKWIVFGKQRITQFFAYTSPNLTGAFVKNIININLSVRRQRRDY